MLLHFIIDSPTGERFNHSFYATELDSHLNALNFFVATGYQIRSASLTDPEGRQTDLPLEAFDGMPVDDAIRELQLEYEQVLNPY
ncbi:hypothetical protein ACFQ4C_00425 [Larkinella insperata]|uniref:Uncharacterized protein n=1 Tax=Larkinella insperata TaxID=332158 RepID=A0ABW3Q0X4_9BACT|nr:hypothetical protein [Larkinella insperata]